MNINSNSYNHGIVLIHGLFSSGKTWSDIDKRIREDSSINAVPIIFEYPSPILCFNPLKAIPDLDTIAQRLNTFISIEMSTYTSLTLVSHSQGGLVIQRFLEQVLLDGRAESLKKIVHIHLIACPNTGSELVLLLRKSSFFFLINPQEKQLRPLNTAVKKSHGVVLNQVIHASVWSERSAPIPINVYAGESDGIVSVESAKGYFPNVDVLPGDHFKVISAETLEAPVFLAITRHLRLQKTIPRYQAIQDISPQTLEKETFVKKIKHNLTNRSNFIGRESDIKRFNAGLTSNDSIISIVGLGGTGKTELARYVAWSLINSPCSKNCHEAVVWCSNNTVSLTLDYVLDEIASILVFPRLNLLKTPIKMLETLEILRTHKILLVIDGIERYDDYELLDFLHSFSTTKSNVIMTSRGKLNLDTWIIKLEGLCEIDAKELIRAESHRLNLPLLRDNGEYWINYLFNVTGGNPFAIKLFCAHLHSGRTGIRELIEEIGKAKLTDLFSYIFSKIWNIDLDKDYDAKLVMTVLSIHANSVSADAVAVTTGKSISEIGKIFVRLNDLSLIDIHQSDIEGEHNRYSVHTLTKVFIQSIVTSREQDTLYDILVKYYLDYAIEYGETYKTEKNIQALDIEKINLIWFADLSYTQAKKTDIEADWQRVIKYSDVLASFLWGRGLWKDRLRLNKQAHYAALQIGDQFSAAIQSVLTGRVYLWLGDIKSAVSELKMAKSLAPYKSTEYDKIPIHRLEAQLASERGDTQLAESILRKILTKAPNTIDDEGRAATLIEIGIALTRQDKHEEALPFFKEALSLDLVHNTMEGCAVSYSHLGNVYLELNMMKDAEISFTEGLKLAIQSNRMSSIGRCKYGLARVNQIKKNYIITLDYARSASNIFYRLGMNSMKEKCTELIYNIRILLTFSTQPTVKDNQFNAVIFDCDDTLLATVQTRWKVLQETALEFGIMLEEQTIRNNWGKPFDKLIKSFIPKLHQEEFLIRYRKAMSYNPPRLTQGAQQALKALYSQDIPIIIVSSSRHDLLIQDLKFFKLDHIFSKIFGHEETFYTKPDSRVLDVPIKYLSSLGITSHEILYIGDSIRDFQASFGAGIVFLGVLTGIESKEDFKNAGLSEKLIINNLQVILDA